MTNNSRRGFDVTIPLAPCSARDFHPSQTDCKMATIK